ncbi:Arabinan endo-1,5-alpha-L-arabinosidase B [Aspergillus desertorum]
MAGLEGPQDANGHILAWPRPRPGVVSSKALTLLPAGLFISRRCRRYLQIALLFVLFFLVSLALSARIRPSFNGTPMNGTTNRWPFEPGPNTIFREEVPPSAAASGFPSAHGTDLRTHDPSIIKVGSTFYSYSVGPRIIIHQASSLDGPWTEMGTVLSGDSIIEKGDRRAPWAANTVYINGRYYCYYSVSNAGCRDSAIGVASSAFPGPGAWTDHGLIIQSGTGARSDVFPLNQSNTIDPNVFVDVDGSAYLNFGSFWTGLWQVPLEEDLVTVRGWQEGGLDAAHLAAEPGKVWRSKLANSKAKAVSTGSSSASPICGDPTGGHPIEGGFLAYHAPYYYMWFSWGRCCEFKDPAMRLNGKEYRIRVGRSISARGPFVDKQGIDLVDGGGETVYGSNGDVFAPGGQGILTDEVGDILYYHYLNSSISYDFGDARLGYNHLEYVDGWPVVVY